MTAHAERSFGVIFLGSSRFPYKDDLDKASFAVAKHEVESALTTEYLVADEVKKLDLFGLEINQADIVGNVYDFLIANPNLTDLIIYYCGHGGFLPGASFYLTLKSTREGREATTGLSLRQFRYDLEDRLFDKRIFLILDCCYAAAAVDDWQLDKGVEEVMANEVEAVFPPSGAALMCAASRKAPAMAPSERDTTLFSGHFVEAVRAGVKDHREELTFSDLADLIFRRIRRERPTRQVLPELHVPQQDLGDVARVPFIRNVSAIRPESPKPTPEPPRWNPSYSPTLTVILSPQRLSIPVTGPPAEKPTESAAGTDGAATEPTPPSAQPTDAIEELSGPDKSSATAPPTKGSGGDDGSGPPPGDSGGGSEQPSPRPHVSPSRRAILYGGVVGAAIAILLAFGLPRLMPTTSTVPPKANGSPNPNSRVAMVPKTDTSPPKLRARGSGSTAPLQQTSTGAKGKLNAPPFIKTAYCGSTNSQPKLASAAAGGKGGPLIPLKIDPNTADRKALHAVAIAPDGSLIATGGDDGYVRIWDARSFKLIQVLSDKTARDRAVKPEELAIYSVDFALDDSNLLVAAASLTGAIRVWDARTGKLVYDQFDVTGEEGTKGQYTVAFYPRYGPRYLYSAGTDGFVYTWDLQRRKLSKSQKVSESTIRTISVAPTGELAIGNWVGQVFFLGKENKEKPRSERLFARLVMGLAYSPYGTRLLAAGNNLNRQSLMLWNGDGPNPTPYKVASRYSVSVAWSPDRTTFASGSGGGDRGDPRSIHVWNLKSSDPIHNYSGHTGDVEALIFAAKGKRLISVSEDGTMRVWGVDSEKELLQVIPYEGGSYLAFTPAGCYTGFDASDAEQHFTLDGNGVAMRVDSVSRKYMYNPDGFSVLAAQ